jgi:hypothetical protein
METAKKIPKLIHEVNRVVYVIGSTGEEEKIAYEITPTRLEPDVIHQLQAADDIVNTELFKHGLLRKLSQVPVVLFVCFLILNQISPWISLPTLVKQELVQLLFELSSQMIS